MDRQHYILYFIPPHLFFAKIDGHGGCSQADGQLQQQKQYP
jgi:hypothetical protein